MIIIAQIHKKHLHFDTVWCKITILSWNMEGDTMNINPFFELHTYDYNVSQIFAMNQTWSNNQQFTMNIPRPTNALLFLDNCNISHRDIITGKTTSVMEQSVFYIPAKSQYTLTFFCESLNKATTKLYEFNLTDLYNKIIPIGYEAAMIDESNPEIYKLLFDKIIYEFSKPVRSPAQIKSVAYMLLANISKAGQKKYMLNNNLTWIYPGIQYLEQSPDQSMTISEIARMCNVSVNYFERLFKEYAGCSPTQYRIYRKIKRAKLLLSNNFLSIKQIAEELNFNDTAYFCRLFKKVTGYTPTQYRHFGAVE